MDDSWFRIGRKWLILAGIEQRNCSIGEGLWDGLKDSSKVRKKYLTDLTYVRIMSSHSLSNEEFSLGNEGSQKAHRGGAYQGHPDLPPTEDRKYPPCECLRRSPNGRETPN